MNKEICQGLTKNGMPCKARALTGKIYCFNHDPDSLRNSEPISLYEAIKEDIENEIARIDGYTILSEHQLKRIAQLVLTMIGQAITEKSLMISEKNEHR